MPLGTSIGSGMRLAAPFGLMGLLLAWPGPSGAQVTPETPEPARVGATAAVVLEGGQVAGARRMFVGGWGGLVFGNDLVVGGGGAALSRRVEITGSESATGFDLGVGFGGIYVRYAAARWGAIAGEWGLLLGAGHAEVNDRLVGLEVGADNFMVLAPEAGLTYEVFRELHLGVSVGYRYVWGVEDLPLLSSEDFRSVTGTLSVRVGGP